MTREKKQSCVLFRTVVEAAKEMSKDDALELLLTYADYAMGDTDDVETDNQLVKLIMKQLVPALNSAEKRYDAACENGRKGKEHGKKGGRPRKGETKEEAYERRNPSKTPEQSPVETPVEAIEKTPVKPLDVDVDVYVDTEVDKESISKDNNISKEDRYKNLTWEEYLKLFINKHPSFNYNLDNSIFVCTYTDILDRYRQFIKDKTSMDIPIPVLARELTYYATFGRAYAGEEVTRPA